jgi:hypothetical protein
MDFVTFMNNFMGMMNYYSAGNCRCKNRYDSLPPWNMTTVWNCSPPMYNSPIFHPWLNMDTYNNINTWDYLDNFNYTFNMPITIAPPITKPVIPVPATPASSNNAAVKQVCDLLSGNPSEQNIERALQSLNKDNILEVSALWDEKYKENASETGFLSELSRNITTVSQLSLLNEHVTYPLLQIAAEKGVDTNQFREAPRIVDRAVIAADVGARFEIRQNWYAIYDAIPKD